MSNSHFEGMKSALLIVDMQNGFMRPNGSLPRMGLDTSRTLAVIDPIKKLREVYHGARLPVIFLQHIHKADGSDMGLIAKVFPPIRALGHCFEGTWDAQLIDELAPVHGDLVVKKSRFSGFYKTDLEGILSGLEVETLVVTGIATNICVESTIRDAFYRDYAVVVPREATAAFTEEQENGALTNFAFAFAEVMRLDEVIAGLLPRPEAIRS